MTLHRDSSWHWILVNLPQRHTPSSRFPTRLVAKAVALQRRLEELKKLTLRRFIALRPKSSLFYGISILSFLRWILGRIGGLASRMLRAESVQERSQHFTGMPTLKRSGSRFFSTLSRNAERAPVWR